MRLSGKQKKALREAMVAAFRTQAAFRMMMKEELDRDLDAVALGDDLAEIVFKAIEQAEAKGWLPAMLDGAAAASPDSPLATMAKELLAGWREAAPGGGEAASGGGEAASGGGEAASGEGYERIIRERAPFVHVDALVDFLQRTKRRVCLLEEEDGAPLGTGFLVGPDVVMTCHHVVRPFVGTDGAGLRARFDHRAGSDGKASLPGTAYRLAKDWLPAFAPSSPLDDRAPDVEPDPAHLDFALVRLATAVGNQRVDGETRGWISLPRKAPALKVDDIVCVVQHPKGRPLQVTLDTVLPQRPWRTRVRYAANTEPGSSGSPCFNLDRKLVAMHHYGRSGKPGTGYNQGIPAAALRAYLDEHKLAHLLGGGTEDADGLEYGGPARGGAPPRTVSGSTGSTVEFEEQGRPPLPPAPPVDLVLIASKAEQDERLLGELLVHLGPSAKANKISIWHAGKVEYGDAIAESAARVESAAVIAFLVSATLLASEEHLELIERAYARSRAGDAALVPVLLSPSDWQETVLKPLQPLPRSTRKPVTQWSDRDAAWVEVAKGLASVVLARRERMAAG